MEPRRWRPRYYNPFTERKIRRDYLPVFRGFFRAMPLHRWSANDIGKVLGYVALNPSLFGFPDHPTCVVNTAYFVPSVRSKPRGIVAFGAERGCKSLIVPASCTSESFDALDVELLSPLFRWNPGVEYLYLSQQCQPMAPHLVPYLSRCHHLKSITLEGWNDAVAIHRVLMACKSVDTVDTYSPQDAPREWHNELSVQALSTLIEMHPKLRQVQSHRLYLMDWQLATQFSRCKHVVALVVFGCEYILLLGGLFLLLCCVPSYAMYHVVKRLCRDRLSEAYIWFWSVMAFVATFISLASVDLLAGKRYGRGWVHLSKLFLLGKRRVDIMMNVHQTSLAHLPKGK